MEEKSLLEASSGCVRLVLDERGRSLRSLELAAQIQNWETSSVRHVALLVGGGDGLTESIRQQADLVWSLSCGTLQHELALLVACEQIYRAYSILRKHPYHREGQVR
jgi:23S rRNA (pseudouridine1915-N3)-methyltransferase